MTSPLKISKLPDVNCYYQNRTGLMKGKTKMKNTFKKLSALLLVLVMVLAMSANAFAADFNENGEEGVAGDWNDADTERLQGNAINIKKEIIAFNANSTTVHAPVVTYTYTVTPAAVANLTITDDTTDHASGKAVTAPVKAGITTGLVVTGANASGTAVAGTEGTAAEAKATLVFDNTSTWTTADDGAVNSYDIGLNFEGVDFTQPGVYRYQIAETISAESYDKIAMKDGAHDTVYLDVYVDGNLDIYGYVCMTENGDVTPTTKKINGFVKSTSEGGSDGADKYYTYDLVLSKDVVNDNYAASNNAFPFTVIFNNPEDYTSTFTIEQTVGEGSTGLSTLTGLPTEWNGVAHVKDGNTAVGTTVGDITLTGIPAGVDVDVYETNDVTGATYNVATTVNGATPVNDANVTWGTTPDTAVAQQTIKEAYQSTKATINTTKNEKVGSNQTLAITNTLLQISPTGIVMRVAPYVLILAAGVALLVLSRRRREDV